MKRVDRNDLCSPRNRRPARELGRKSGPSRDVCLGQRSTLSQIRVTLQYLVYIIRGALSKIAALTGLEELDLGVGIGLGRANLPMERERNCRVAGGTVITDLGLAKLAPLKNLRRLDLSGAKLTAAGLKSLRNFPKLERLSLWNCTALDDAAAAVYAALPSLANLDLSDTAAGDKTLEMLAAHPRLKVLYLTDTKVTPEAVQAYRAKRPAVFVSWARRPEAAK